MRAESAQRRLWALFALALLALAAGIGMRDPSPPDEPRFALAAKTMVESGHWLTPQRGSELYAEKPATFMWLQAGFYALIGDLDIAFLLPSLLAGLLTLWLIADLARRLWRPSLAPWAVGALFISLQFGLQVKRAQIDMTLTAMTTVALWGLLVHFIRGPNRRALCLAGFAAGLGTVTKGVGFLPLLMLIVFALWRSYAARRALTRPNGGWQGSAWLLPTFIAGALVWLAPVLLATWWYDTPELRAYTHELLFRQTGTRYLNAWHHHRPVWYYLQVVLTLWLPGALLLPWLLPAWWRRLRRGDLRYWLLLGWSLLVLLFFSASSGKREVYIFPALPAMALATAPLLPGLLRRSAAARWLLRGYLILLGGTAAVIAIGGWRGLPAVMKLADKRGLIDSDLQQLVIGCALLALVAAVALAMSQKPRIGRSLIGFTAALWISYGLLLAPALDASSSGKQLMTEVAERLPASAELGIVDLKEQLLLQADRPMQDWGYKQPLTAQWAGAARWLQADPTRWVMVQAADLPPCVAESPLLPLGRANRLEWELLPGTALTPDCAKLLIQASEATP